MLNILNKKAIDFIKNFTYSLSSNLITFIISTLLVLIVPKLIGVEEYGYWQLYIFYSSYVGFLHFGWNDGIYLRYGGQQYSDLDKALFCTQFYMLFLFQALIGIVVYLLSSAFIDNDNRLFVFKMISLVLVLVNVRYMLLFILQATNKINHYAYIIIFDRMIYLIFIVVIIVFKYVDFRIMIICDVFAKLMSLIYSMYLCKAIVFNKIKCFYLDFKETFDNISVGIKLMFANIASFLVIGIIRFGIERAWDVSTFGKISLMLSISNMMMVFINAMGIIIFPLLRRTKNENLSLIYITIRDILMMSLLGILIIYYPLKQLLQAWLPQYSESMVYLAIIFPAFIYEGKMALLINTYLKVLRKERFMLNINLVTMLISVILTYICVHLLNNLDLTVLIIIVILALRCLLAEVILSKELKVTFIFDFIAEMFLTVIFIYLGWFIDSWVIVLIFIIFYFIYLYFKRKQIYKSLNMVKNIFFE